MTGCHHGRVPTIDVDGAQLDYSQVGSGPTVVTLHGLTRSRAHERAMGIEWSTAFPGHTVVSYDARGHGASTGRDRAEDYRWSALADDLLTVLARLGLDDPVDALGTSMGVGTILHAAVRMPERFRRLVLVTPPTAWETRRSQAEMYEAGAQFVEQSGLDALVAATAQMPVPPALGEVPVQRPAIAETLLPTVLRGAGLSDLPSPDEVAELTHPMLILAWTDDPGHPISTAEALLELLPDSVLAVASTPDELAEWPALAAGHLAG